jgi:hypothetical protein
MDVHTSPFASVVSPVRSHWTVDGSFVSSKGIEGASEELWEFGAGPAEESWVLEREDQGCVDAFLPLTKYSFPLPNPLISPVTARQ